MSYSNYQQVVDAINQAESKSQLCQIADEVDALFMADQIVVSDEDWANMSDILAMKSSELDDCDMTFFFGAENPLSNWHPSVFTVNGIQFCNNEQFMMYCKARLFGDEATAAKILAAKTPREHKALGRQVTNFVESIWKDKCESYVRQGCYAKFSQNPKLLQFLLDTQSTELVEASPFDKVWGVGLAESDPCILDKKNWPGQNLLGKVLMQVRAKLQSEELNKKE